MKYRKLKAGQALRLRDEARDLNYPTGGWFQCNWMVGQIILTRDEWIYRRPLKQAKAKKGK